jgi:hypothetical protein
MKYIFFTDLQSYKVTKLQKVIPKGASVSFVLKRHSKGNAELKLLKLQKLVPKGAQRKFSAQKSFQRE